MSNPWRRLLVTKSWAGRKLHFSEKTAAGLRQEKLWLLNVLTWPLIFLKA